MKTTRFGILLVLIVLMGVTFFSVSAATLDVDMNDAGCDDTVGAPFCSIQAAIDAASVGDVIRVAAGTYDEQLVLTKDLMLQGVGNVILEPSLWASDAINIYSIVKIDGADVEIDGFTMQGPVTLGPAAAPTSTHRIGFFGIFVIGDGHLNLHDSKVLEIREDPLSGNQRGVAIQVGRSSMGEFGTLVMRDSEVSGFQKNGVTIDGATSYGELEGNKVACAGATTVNAQNGVQVSYGAGADLTDNEVTGCYYDDPAGSWTATCILGYSGGYINLTGNTVTGCNNGLYAYDVDVVSSGNRYCDNSDGAGLYLSANPSATASFDGDTFCNINAAYWDGAGIWMQSSAGNLASHLTVHGSSFTGNEFDVQNWDSDQLDATGNWWGGTFCGAAVVTGNVLYDPCLASAPGSVASGGSGGGSGSGSAFALPSTGGDFALPQTGFAPDVVTRLPLQPAEKAFEATTMVLSVPSLGVSASIVGVPHYDSGWDVTWLGDDVGFLEGTAYPTWTGNTVLTGHVWNADNSAGIFANLKDLQFGDQFSIFANGSEYVYEVRASRQVGAEDESVVGHRDFDVVTLVTCESFVEETGAYGYRRAVEAVLMAVR